MANFYYNVQVVSCRNSENPNGAAQLDKNVPHRTWEYLFEALGVADAAAGKAAFLAAFEAKVPTANNNFKYAKTSGTGSLTAALNSSTVVDSTNGALGPWNERVGKEWFRYRIGVSDTDAATAVGLLTSHNLA